MELTKKQEELINEPKKKYKKQLTSQQEDLLNEAYDNRK